MIKLQLIFLKRQEAALAEEERRLNVEKSVHLREMKRVRDEDSSRFKNLPILNGRYQILRLLGKGGFSEVWGAFDLNMYCEVAIKIHQLSVHWTDAKKQNYIRHATREYAIHKSLQHPRVVRLFDVFEIDANSFATAMEYCDGGDLDLILKSKTSLPEKEARSILLQVLTGLKYLNDGGGAGEGVRVEMNDMTLPAGAPNRRHAIIHYDLKPANILFTESGTAKITDFGLSKIIDDEAAAGGGMELTSQGAGTYWYLPPETFQVGSGAPRISSKVDVWSLGVMFYQMLFGVRPFGDKQTQESLVSSQTILNAREVRFPSNEKVGSRVSDSAKDFIRRCLTYEQHLRPDVLELVSDPYLYKKL